MIQTATVVVIVVDPDVVGRTKTALSQSNYQIVEVRCVGQVVEHSMSVKPDLVIVDMPGQDVADLCKAIKSVCPEAAILQIGGPAQPGPSCLRAAGLDAFMASPVEAAALFTLVRVLVKLQQTEIKLCDSERRLELAQEAAELAILDWGIASNTFVHSALFADLFDLPARAPGEPFASSVLVERIHPDDRQALRAELSLDNQAARRFDWEFRIVRRDGAVRWISSRGRFFTGPSGKLERMISLSFDITERKEADRINAQLASIVTSSSDAIVSVDLANRITTWNAGAERLFGYLKADTIGRPLDDLLVHREPSPIVPHRQTFVLEKPAVFETNQTTRDGAVIDISVNSAPMLGSHGEVIGASLIMRDIAPQKRREDHVRFLMRELTHRSKNLLAVIQAMARQSLNKDTPPDEFVKRFSNRLSGLAGSHDLLSSLDWQGASLIELIRSQLRHYEDLFETRIILDGTDIIIRPEAAQNIGIALHELSTNAAKYGALSTQAGQVTVAWHIYDRSDGVRRLAMTWREEQGPPVVPPTRRGFGHIVMDKIAGKALDGTSKTQFLAEGVVWALDVPVASVIHK